MMDPDVEHTFGVERAFMRGPLELGISGGGAYGFNRDFGADGRNYFGTVRLRWTPNTVGSNAQAPGKQ